MRQFGQKMAGKSQFGSKSANNKTAFLKERQSARQR